MKTRERVEARGEALAHAAMRPPGEALEAWRRWRTSGLDPRRDPVALRWLPLIGWNLQHTNLDSASRALFREALQGMWASNVRLLDAAAPVLDALAAAGVRVMLLKGAALALTVYETPGLRPIGDVDLLVDPGQAPAAVDLLAAHRWRPLRRRPTQTPTFDALVPSPADQLLHVLARPARTAREEAACRESERPVPYFMQPGPVSPRAARLAARPSALSGRHGRRDLATGAPALGLAARAKVVVEPAAPPVPAERGSRYRPGVVAREVTSSPSTRRRGASRCHTRMGPRLCTRPRRASAPDRGPSGPRDLARPGGRDPCTRG
jgi:hypothetical protein